MQSKLEFLDLKKQAVNKENEKGVLAQGFLL